MTRAEAAVVRTPGVAGREDLLDTLADAARAALGGRGSAYLVEGEAGIGKTTLLEEFARRAPAGLHVVWSRARPDGDAPVLWVWTQLLQALPAAYGSSTEALLGGGASTATRAELFDAVARLIERQATATPIALVVDDVQWADTASVLLLAYLSGRVARHRIFVLGALRTGEEIVESVLDAQAELLRVANIVALHGLDTGALVQMLDDAGIDADAALVETLMARTRGNPFFVSRLIAIVRANRSRDLQTRRMIATEVPGDVAEVVRRRVARMPTAAARLLSAAAVLGEEGDLELLAAVTGLDVAEVLELVEATDGLLVESATNGFRFSHALVRDSVYATLSGVDRRRLHLRALDATPPGDGSVNARARHAVAALPLGECVVAAELCVEAGRAAATGFAFEDAAERFALALEVGGGDLTDRERGVLLLEMGEALRQAGASERARQACVDAARLVQDDPELLARAAFGFADPGADLAIAYQSSELDTTTLLERAIDSWPAGAVGARLRARLASELYFSSDPARSRPLAVEALEMATRSEDDAAIVAAAAVHHDAFVVGHVSAVEALTDAERIMRRARASGDVVALLTAHRVRLFDLVSVGDIAGVDAESKAFAVQASSVSSKAYLWWPALWRAMRSFLDGRHEDAERDASVALELGQKPFGGLAFTNYSFLLFFLRREQGRMAELEAMTRSFAVEQADIPAIQAGLALVLAEVGKLDEARGVLSQLGGDDFHRLHDRNWSASWFQLARAAYLSGDRLSAEKLFEQGRRLSGECVMVSLATVCLGSADLALAWCLDTVGDFDAADAAYRRAAATNARIGARSWQAQTQVDHAGLLLGSGSDDGRAEALDLCQRALDAAERIGLVAVASRVRELIGLEEASARAGFVRQGVTWQLQWDGKTVTIGHAKGLADIAWMLARPHEPVPAVELIARQGDGAASNRISRGDPMLDDRARHELRDRLVELRHDLAAAEDANDIDRASVVRVEMDAMLEATSTALGLGGRSRRLGDDVERARKTVTARIRNAINHINALHPSLGAHLDRSIDTGTWCVYRPERPTTWKV